MDTFTLVQENELGENVRNTYHLLSTLYFRPAGQDVHVIWIERDEHGNIEHVTLSDDGSADDEHLWLTHPEELWRYCPLVKTEPMK